jgi:hypothetical protein
MALDDDRIETSLPTTFEPDALDEQRLLEVPVERPELVSVDHDVEGGWPQYAERPEFDHTGEEVADQDLVAQERHERGLDIDD